MLLFQYLALFFVLLLTPALAATALDGTGTGQISGAATNTIAATLTTTQTNDVIIVAVNVNNASAITVSSVAGGSLTWTKRTAVAMVTTTSFNDNIEIWWAPSTGTLSAVTITVTFSGNASSAAILAFGVSGANTSTPFDTNGGLPFSNTNTSNAVGVVPSVNISTSNANDFIFAILGGTTASPTLTDYQAGFTTIASKDGFSGSPNFTPAFINGEYQVVSATQSSVAVGYTGSKTAWILIVDAIVQAGGAATPTASIKTLLGAGK